MLHFVLTKGTLSIVCLNLALFSSQVLSQSSTNTTNSSTSSNSTSSGSSSAPACIKASCISKSQTSSTLCLRQSDGTATQGGNVQYIYDQCDTTNRMFCDPFIESRTNKYNGTCSKNSSQFEYTPTYIQFPGELCDPNRAFYECGFGYKKCLAKRCYGFLAGEACISSADCNPHLYCD